MPLLVEIFKQGQPEEEGQVVFPLAYRPENDQNAAGHRHKPINFTLAYRTTGSVKWSCS